MKEQYSRSVPLFGEEGMKRIAAARVAVFGIGGVGGYCVEALARTGVGTLDLIDSDRVSLSNLNRQLHALRNTVGQYKVDAAAERIHAIDPEIQVNTYRAFYGPETAEQWDISQYDYIVDAIDTVSAKLDLVERAAKAKVPMISSMGAGNKLDPTCFQVADISKTSVCPLARVMRRELKKRGIAHLKVVYSTEQPVIRDTGIRGDEDHAVRPEGIVRRATPGSCAFVPSVVGLILAGEVLKDLAQLRL